MKTVFLNAGNETGGGLVHVVSLLKKLKHESIDLIVFEEGPVAKAARKEGIDVYVFEQSNPFDLSVLFRLRTFINNRHYNIVHTHGPRANVLMATLIPFIRVKWVTTIHSHPLLDFKNQGLKGKLLTFIHCQALKRAHGFIAVSNEIKSVIENLGVESGRIEVIHNGIQFSQSHRPVNNKITQPFTLITVGRLTEIKGYSILMDALNSFEKKDWQWIVCGDGEEMNALVTKAKQYNLDQQIYFKGWLTTTEINSVFHYADLFVLSSLSESFPLSLLEAASEKVPAIATHVGDVSDVIKDDTMGWLIPPKDSTAMKEALQEAYVLWEKGKLSFKGEQLYTHASSFTIEKQTQAVMAFYKNITSET